MLESEAKTRAFTSNVSWQDAVTALTRGSSQSSELARAQARKNIDAMLSDEFDAIVTNAAGCGSTMKEYAALLEHDPKYSQRAMQFVTKVRDINEYLAQVGLLEPKRKLAKRVTYADPCHLAHAQGIRKAPRELLKAFTTWRSSAWVGTLSALGSACWFFAFAIAPVALVRSVGQVEIVFTLLFSRFYLKETLKPGDVAGLVLVVCGVLLIVLAS